jgi:hypothetical protein
LLCGLLLAGTAGARILDSHTEIRIAKSGEVTVTERVELQVDPRQPHSVLLRDIAAPARVLDVLRNGRPEPWELVNEGARLRIGARGKALENGRHVYQIAYRARAQVRFLDYHDELRWNLPPADRITAEVSLPASVPARDMRVTATGGDYQGFLRDGRAAVRSAKQPIVVTVRFPKDVVAAPELDYRGLVFVLGGLLAAAGAMFWIKAVAAQRRIATAVSLDNFTP